MALGESLLRREDPRLLTGGGQYISDLQVTGMLHAGFVRSPFARARIRSIDLEPARQTPGVVLALSAADTPELPSMFDSSNSSTELWLRRVRPRMQAPRVWPLARGEVVYAGQPVAIVVGDSRYAVEDGLDAAVVDYEPLPPILDPVAAAAPDAEKVYADLADNVLFEYLVRRGDGVAGVERAPRKLSQSFRCGRNTAVPIENRGLAAVPDTRFGTLTVHAGTSGIHTYRRVLAQMLGLPEPMIRVVAPDTGGGFGGKNGAYPEDVAVAYAARKLGRPVKWLADRHEDLQMMTHSRGMLLQATAGYDEQGRILGVAVQQWMDAGAYQPQGPVVPYQVSTHLLGPYRIEHFEFHGRALATNKTPTGPYRGAGRPEATFVMESLVDLIARDLRLDPAELRRRNLITPDQMPYNVGIPFRDGGDVVYDSGDYPELLRLALGQHYEQWRARQRSPEPGKRIGIGLACYVEATGTGPFEGATISLDASGQLTITTAACSQGQGHEVSMAQVVAELWGVPVERVNVLLGDTGRIAFGAGTYASRTLQLVSAAAAEASSRLQAKLRELAAGHLEAAPEDLEIDLAARQVVVRGDRRRGVPLAQLARAAAPGWRNAGLAAGGEDQPEIGGEGSPGPNSSLPTPGTTSVALGPGLQATAYFATNAPAWASAAHMAVVEVDMETGGVRVKHFVVAHDAGRIVNPLLADGQVVGGVATGIGGALTEEIVHDEAGQQLTASLMDYLVPTSMEVPPVETVHLETPSPLNPLGIKGLGEGGTVGAPAAIANAVSDALGVTAAELPLTPDRVYRLIQQASNR